VLPRVRKAAHDGGPTYRAPFSPRASDTPVVSGSTAVSNSVVGSLDSVYSDIAGPDDIVLPVDVSGFVGSSPPGNDPSEFLAKIPSEGSIMCNMLTLIF